jgi:hypothetical protein
MNASGGTIFGIAAGVVLGGLVMAARAAPAGETMSYIENEHLRLGANLAIGGSITHLSARGGPNMINSHDWGRQIQMSFYSGPSPFEPGGKKAAAAWAGWGWNPIQSGDHFGNGARVLEHRNTGREIYVKCRPMQWALDNEPGDCIFECWYRLEENRVHVRSRITNTREDKTQYPARTQELPAIYTNGPWYKLVTYQGERPFSGEPLTVLVDRDDGKGWPWRNFYAPEHWVALVDENDKGLGVYLPHACGFTGGFAGAPKGRGGEKDSQTGYMGPTIREILDHNIVYTYDYALVVGSVKDIRDFVYQREKNRSLPRWTFAKDRQHWIYENITDAGWPIRDGLRFTLGPPSANLVSPKTFWRAEEAPVLVLRAGFRTAAKSGTILLQPYDRLAAGDWAQWGPERDQRPKPAPAIEVPFQIQGDGVVRDLAIDLSKVEAYRGSMTQVKIRLPAGEGTAIIHAVELKRRP